MEIKNRHLHTSTNRTLTRFSAVFIILLQFLPHCAFSVRPSIETSEMLEVEINPDSIVRIQGGVHNCSLRAFEDLFDDFGYARARPPTFFCIHRYKSTTMMLPSSASVVLARGIGMKEKRKETMPFHVCTYFEHARYAPNTLPSCNAVVCMTRYITGKRRERANT